MSFSITNLYKFSEFVVLGNSVNFKFVYSQIEIRSQKDIIEYETGK